MGYNFDFAFLGRNHSYAASVTQVPTSGFAIEPADTVCFRLPESWTKQYQSSALTRYIFDIRGHDFLSYTGRWASEDAYGISPKSENIIQEMGALRALGEELQRIKCHRADYKLTLGAQAGSYFADVKKLKTYRSEFLPRGLENAIGDEVIARSYGVIAGVAMNATGGWVVHFVPRFFSKRKHQFRFGGALPQLLVTALEAGQQREAKISHIFLNHQHADEFVLIFNDGVAHVNLHYDFERSIRRLIETWVDKSLHKKKKFMWTFTYSSQCHEPEQKQKDAAYYNRRAYFFIFLSKSTNDPELAGHYIDLALAYLKESIDQDPKSMETLHIERMALVAARGIKNDAELERRIAKAWRERVPPVNYVDLRDSTPAGSFRNQYLNLIKSEEDYLELSVQVERLIVRTPEWSYSMASAEGGLPGIGVFGDDTSPTETRSPGELESPQTLNELHFPIRREDPGFRSERDVAFQRNRRPSEFSGQHFVAELESPQVGPFQRRPSELADDENIRRTESEGQQSFVVRRE